jgi:hypothetical protein
MDELFPLETVCPPRFTVRAPILYQKTVIGWMVDKVKGTQQSGGCAECSGRRRAAAQVRPFARACLHLALPLDLLKRMAAVAPAWRYAVCGV